jgi:hypothetical protein
MSTVDLSTAGRSYLGELVTTGNATRHACMLYVRCLVDDRTVDLLDACIGWWTPDDLDTRLVVDASTISEWVDALNRCAALAERTDPLGECLHASAAGRLATLGLCPGLDD